MKEIHLTGKKIIVNRSPVLLRSVPDENWEKDWMVMAGRWEYKNGFLIGTEERNQGGILFTKRTFDEDVMMTFKVSTVLPATRDLNAVFCAKWDKKTDYLGESYVCGVNGWWENKAGIESNSPNGFCALTNSYRYVPGTEITMTAGSIDGHTFMVIDDNLIMEYKDPTPIRGGHMGFSPYCTRLKIRDIAIRRIYWEEFRQSYTPEF